MAKVFNINCFFCLHFLQTKKLLKQTYLPLQILYVPPTTSEWSWPCEIVQPLRILHSENRNIRVPKLIETYLSSCSAKFRISKSKAETCKLCQWWFSYKICINIKYSYLQQFLETHSAGKVIPIRMRSWGAAILKSNSITWPENAWWLLRV